MDSEHDILEDRVARLLLSLSALGDVGEALTATADDMGAPGWDSAWGYGIVNPVAALEYEPEAPEPPPRWRS